MDIFLVIILSSRVIAKQVLNVPCVRILTLICSVICYLLLIVSEGNLK